MASVDPIERRRGGSLPIEAGPIEAEPIEIGVGVRHHANTSGPVRVRFSSKNPGVPATSDDAIEESDGISTDGRGVDDRSEEGDRAIVVDDVDHGGADVVADRFDRALVARSEAIVDVGRVVGAAFGEQSGGESDGGERFADHLVVDRFAGDVDPLSERVVPGPQRDMPVIAFDRDRDAGRRPRPVDEVPVEVRHVVATLVEDRQAHHSDRQFDPSHPLHFDEPA